MSQSLGSKIAEYRKNLGMTQDELAEKLGVTPQAVSKWSLVKAALEIGMNIPEISVGDAVKNIDFSQIFAVIERGVIGKLVEIESANGDRVEISVE